MNDLSSAMERILISPEELDVIITDLATQINRDFQSTPGRQTLVLSVLKGAVFFTTALLQKLTVPVQIDFVKVSSYRDGTETGALDLQLFPRRDDWKSLDVLLVEDIVDSGRTLNLLVRELKRLGATNVRVATLLDKPARRIVDFHADYIGRVIPDEFVVGFGLDWAERYRQLPYIAIPRA